MRDTDELHPERAELERLVARRRGDQLRLLREAVLVELRLHERQRQRGRDDRLHVDLAQEVRQPADVILVTMRENHRANVSALEVADVRQQEIDAEVLVAREREARVDDDDLVAHLEDGHVLADLAETAERDDAERVAHGLSLRTCAARAATRRPAGATRAVRGSRGRLRAPRPSLRRAAAGARRPRAREDSART